MKLPGMFEFLVLCAVDTAEVPTGTEIVKRLTGKGPRKVSSGALYSTLDRLEEKGLLTWRWLPPRNTRGGRRQKTFALTKKGLKTLNYTRDFLRKILAK